MVEHGKKERTKERDVNFRPKYITENASRAGEQYLPESGAASMDIYESKNHIFVEMDLAGADPKNITVEVDKDNLTIEGRKGELVPQEPNVVFHCAERSFGSFRRVFGIGSTIDSKNIEAHFKNGVLLLKLPKLQDRRKTRHKIKVQVDD
ncbi:MAG: Hsp20/alpha crystallin family protein [Nitrospinae bacterium]|nr:Hsp20/alpha crystallin family protein [Nitrospinota bacterium]